jgi:folylpolyglutamate synthase
MSFHIFLKEEVDITIYKVGVRGKYNSINVVERPIITDITALNIDYIRVLRETIEEIA